MVVMAKPAVGFPMINPASASRKAAASASAAPVVSPLTSTINGPGMGSRTGCDSSIPSPFQQRHLFRHEQVRRRDRRRVIVAVGKTQIERRSDDFVGGRQGVIRRVQLIRQIVSDLPHVQVSHVAFEDCRFDQRRSAG